MSWPAPCAALGLLAPSFRSPPSVPGADRTLRRVPGGVHVAIRLWGRSFAAIRADMIEGVLAANTVAPAEADELRARLASAAPLPQQGQAA